MARLIDTAVGNVGRIITDLRPSRSPGLVGRARMACAGIRTHHRARLPAALSTSTSRSPNPPQATAIAVFRIFQEMLSNVARHAQARSVTVDVVARDGVRIVRVDDDGIGASPAAIDHACSWGVLGMRERARQVGGTLRVHAAPGRGTCVELRIESTVGGAL